MMMRNKDTVNKYCFKGLSIAHHAGIIQKTPALIDEGKTSNFDCFCVALRAINVNKFMFVFKVQQNKFKSISCKDNVQKKNHLRYIRSLFPSMFLRIFFPPQNICE